MGVFLIQFLIFIVCTIFFVILPLVLPNLQGYTWVYYASYLSCLAALFTQNWFLQAYSDFKTIALLSFISKLLSFILIISMIKKESDVLAYVVVVNSVSFLLSLFVFFYSVLRYKIKFSMPGVSLINALVSDGRYLFLSAVVTNLYTTTGIVLLGAMSTKTDVGFYTSAQKLMDVSKSVLLMPISQIIFPILSRKFGFSKDEGLYSVRKILPLFSLISIGFLIFVNLFKYYIVIILFGEKFLPILPMVSILSVGLFAVFYGVFIGGQVMLNLGMDKAFLRIQIYIAIFSLLLNYFFIKQGGGLVTSIIWSVSEVIIALYQIVFLYINGVRIFTWSMLSPKSIIESLKYVLKKDG